MFAPSVLLFAWLAVDVTALPVREERSTAIWFEPQLRFHAFGTGRADVLGSDMSALPLGLEVGHRVGRVALVSLTLARLPIQDGAQTLGSAGVRVYLRPGLVAPYAAAVIGAVSKDVPDAGRTDTSPFVMLGPGLEVATRNGFSLTTDFLIGPENQGDGPDRSWTTSWHLSGFYRLGLGYRF
jgi:hypothetical protein